MRLMRPPGRSRNGLWDLISLLPCCNAEMVEVGSHSGESASLFLASGKFAKIYCVDQWSTKDHEESEVAFDARFLGRPEIVKLKMESGEGAKTVNDQSIDFIYIDAGHSYPSIRRDIDLWLPKIRKGGWIGGHDFSWEFQGVIQAVHETFGKPYRVFQDSSWACHVG